MSLFQDIPLEDLDNHKPCPKCGQWRYYRSLGSGLGSLVCISCNIATLIMLVDKWNKGGEPNDAA